MQIARTNTILYCHRWSETVAFYQDMFRFPVNFQSDWFIEFQLTPAAYLSIADARRATISSAAGQGITLSWQVPDLETARIELQQGGIRVTEITKKWGARLFYLQDPEGHRIELWQPLTD